MSVVIFMTYILVSFCNLLLLAMYKTLKYNIFNLLTISQQNLILWMDTFLHSLNNTLAVTSCCIGKFVDKRLFPSREKKSCCWEKVCASAILTKQTETKTWTLMENRLSCKGVFVTALKFQLSPARKRPLKNKHLNPCFYNWSQIPIEREAEDKIRCRNGLTAWTALALETFIYAGACRRFGICMIHPDELTDRVGS